MPDTTTVVQDEVELVEGFIPPDDANRLFDGIAEKARWRQQQITLFGQTRNMPRLTAWYGDPGASYSYSGVKNVPLPWFDELTELRDRIIRYTRSEFNSVLLNLYRDGADSMGRHRDNEPELGESPLIASISLGATRRFILHPVLNKNVESRRIELSHGALLLMSGQCQTHWYHSVPKTRREVGPRINLTYRDIHQVARAGGRRFRSRTG